MIVNVVGPSQGDQLGDVARYLASRLGVGVPIDVDSWQERHKVGYILLASMTLEEEDGAHYKLAHDGCLWQATERDELAAIPGYGEEPMTEEERDYDGVYAEAIEALALATERLEALASATSGGGGFPDDEKLGRLMGGVDQAAEACIRLLQAVQEVMGR